MKTGYLILESGDIFQGEFIGNTTAASGEVVFNTCMTGYQEILTDPSYAGQIMTFCYPLIGNYGINPFESESGKIQIAGAIMSDLCTTPSHYLAAKSFGKLLEEAGVPGITGVDTRAVVKKIREQGVMKGIISDIPKPYPKETSVGTSDMALIESVSTKQIQYFGQMGPHIVLFDYGHKKSIVEALVKQGCQVTVVPYSTTLEELQALKPDGVVFSNGPGDPKEMGPLYKEVARITKEYPSLGICLGHQLIALAYGAKTEKLLFGHRGGNHPVKELHTGKVWITSQNHGYVVKEETVNPQVFEVTYRNINDQSVEGLKHKNLPIETVQFHPEAHPGPADTYHLFKRFIQNIQHAGENIYATSN